MKLTFLGATRTVTGSRYLIEADGKKILIDCGLFQGYKELRLRNWQMFPISPAEIDAVVLTHAHLDHSGYLPLMVKQGFKGKIYCTPPTFDLCKLLLPDSGYIQEEDAKRANKYRYSKHDPALPLYTLADAEAALEYFHTCPFGKDINIGNIHFRFERNGHILGAAWVLLTVEKRTVLFSGDVGRPEDPVMKAPVLPVATDYVVVESTYGDRCHEKTDPLDQLEPIIQRTIKRSGTVIIPAFAVGRAQSLIYYLYMLKEAKRINDTPVYLDSPMAINATDILEKYKDEHRLSTELCANIMNSVTYVHTPDQSRELDNFYPKIIIAASGMATGGRVLHHIKNLGSDRKNTILFSGFQAGGTRGDRILKGEKEVKIHGEMVTINAEIAELDNTSAHGDYEEIINWLSHMPKPPIKTFITHGEESASIAMKGHIEGRLGWECVIPNYMDSIEL
jgi:metallo-beta-lactamase family protein